MPFNPSLPATGAPLESAVMRDQLQALFNLINAIGRLIRLQQRGGAAAASHRRAHVAGCGAEAG
jgi:hypothetical protein